MATSSRQEVNGDNSGVVVVVKASQLSIGLGQEDHIWELSPIDLSPRPYSTELGTDIWGQLTMAEFSLLWVASRTRR